MNEELMRDEELLENGGMDLDEFCEKHSAALYERHIQDMPYGTAKARTGDPDEWIYEYYHSKYFG